MPIPFPTISTQRRNRNPKGVAGPVQHVIPSLTLSVAYSDIPNDPAVPIIYSFTVLRLGGNVGVSDATWRIAPAAGSTLPASYFSGGVYPSGNIHLIDGQGQQVCIFTVAAGADPVADLFGHLVIENFVNCRAGSVVDYQLRAPGVVLAADYIVSLSVPIVDLARDDTADHAYTVTVSRTRADNDYSQTCSVQLALTGSGATPITAGDMTGGLLNQTVSFAAGEQSKDFLLVVKAGADPATDLTGDVAISSPTSCKIDPTASSVAVKIPQAVVVNPPGILPPEYTDPNFTGMTPYSPAPANWTQLAAACAALSGTAQCKTKYIQPTSAYNDTALRNLNYKGYVEPGTGKIYPLIITSNPAKANSRAAADIAARPHFRQFTMNGAQWMWLHGLAIEDPVVGGSQTKSGDVSGFAGINMDGSTDCFVTRCWLDTVTGIFMLDAVRPHVGANDFYGTTGGNPPWSAQFYARCDGKTVATQTFPVKPRVYQNFFGNLRAPIGQDPAAAFYNGEGLSPALSYTAYPDNPYPLGPDDGWFFNNLIMTTKNYLIYNKHAWNVWRNRVCSINKWTDTTGTGSCFHNMACRGGNWVGGTLKYNVGEAASGHHDFQSWNGVAEFNDWGGLPLNVFIHCHDPNKLADGRYSKTLLAASHWRFRGNKNGDYQVGSYRFDAGYDWYAPLVDDMWEGEVNCTWHWESDFQQTISSVTYTAHHRPNGTVIQWGANNKNSELFEVQFPLVDGNPAHFDIWRTGCAIGQLTNLPTTAVVPQLTLAYAANGFTKAEKGIVSQEGIVWDYVGDGSGGLDPYRLTQDNFTLHYPSDTMATDYPNCVTTWLAGGGFEVKAGLGNAIDVGKHACLSLWMKNKPPHDAATFTFYFTRLDNLAAFDSDGVFALFRERFTGLATYGADPNGWAAASWRTDPNYPTPGSDLIYRERGTGYRNSFANRSLTAQANMQCRLRTYNGTALDQGTQINDTTGFTGGAGSGGEFDIPLNVKCKIEFIRSGNSLTAKRTRTDDNSVQTWTWSDPLIGTSGRGVDGWCGFGFYLGMWGRVEPVPGVPFCQ